MRVKCIRIEESEFVGSDNSKRIQRVLIADSSSLLWLALWEDNIGQLAEGKSYNLNGMRVKEYMNEKSLSATYGSSIDEIDDIGDVKEDAAEVDKSDSMSELVINGAEVIGGKIREVRPMRDVDLQRQNSLCRRCEVWRVLTLRQFSKSEDWRCSNFS